MIRTLSLLIIFLIPLYGNCYAQFISFQISVEPEINTKVEQELNFGTFVSNSGKQEISLGDFNMGIFSIRALYTQNLFLLLEYPEELFNSNPKIQASIPIELSMAYSDSETQNLSKTTIANENRAFISISDLSGPATNEVWKSVFIYVFGSVFINDIPNGTYVGDINLIIDYD